MAKNDVIEKILKKEWYIQGFNAVPLLMHHGMIATTRRMWDAIGYGYDITLNMYENDYCEMYYSVSSLKNIYRIFMKEYSKDKRYIKRLIEKSKKEVEIAHTFIMRLRQLDLTNLSDKELIALFKKMMDIYPWVVTTNHVIEGFSLNSDAKLKKLLYSHLKKRGMEKEFTKYLTILTTPSDRSLMSIADEALIKISRKIKKEPKLLNLFKKNAEEILIKVLNNNVLFNDLFDFQKKFYWTAANYSSAPIGDIMYIIKHLKIILNEKERKPAKDSIPKKEKEKIMKKLNIKGELLELIRLTDIFTIWQDRRKRDMLMATCYVDLLAKITASRFGIEYENIHYIMPEEISYERLKNLSNDELSLRRKGCAVIYTRKESFIIHGKEYAKMKDRLKKDKNYNSIREIPGMGASIGKVIGRVQICKTMEDIRNFKEGNVLVTKMTRPEFLPAMKKASAIITDEGGITSHAAIVSRELGIPCIIGTKNATEILKNGDLVEVKANHNMIVILEK